MAGKFVSIVDLTHDDEDTHSHMFDVPLQLPASANAASNYSALGTFSQVEGDLMRNDPSFHPMPSQTGVHPWQLRYPKTYPQDSQAVLGPQETVQLVTQRAREGLHVQRESSKCFASSTRIISRCPWSIWSRCAEKIVEKWGAQS